MSSALRLPVLLASLLVAFLAVAAPARGEEQSFSQRVDLTPLGRIAVHSDGRLKSLGSHANEMMRFVSGPRTVAGQDPLFTYIDMMLRSPAYRDADIVYVKNKQVREQIIAALSSDPQLAERLATFRKTGLLSPQLLADERLVPLFRQLAADVVRTAKQMDQIDSALSIVDPRFLLDRMRLIPPGNGDTKTPWHGIEEVMFVPGKTPIPQALMGLAGQSVPIDGVDMALQGQIADAWRDFVNAWLGQDAPAVTRSADALATLLPQVAPSLYPNQSRLAWENWYFQHDQLTSIWLAYFAAVIVLLLGVVYRWPFAARLGTVLFLLCFALQTFALLLRWYISARWPNANMFEAVTTAAWFGGCAAIVMEFLVRKTAMRGLFFLGSAVSSMVALMVAHFLPVYLNPDISNMMPVLHDVWLYIHTNVIIFSYCLIFMAAVTAGVYLAWRLIGNGPAYARVGGAGSLVLAGAPGNPGAASKTSFGEVLDGVTMVLMELSFVLLWAGIVMGAIWADHSWGRPWGWDPKEVFALNTFVVFALLIHVRLKVRDKGLWTAVLAVVGAGVMLFNWIVINFVITGLHSYA